MKIIIILLVAFAIFLISQTNSEMSIFRKSSVYNTGGTIGTTYTISGYDPAYAGTERGRIIFVSFRNFQTVGGASAVVDITYGGRTMRRAAGHVIGNFVTSIGIFYVINPPTGTQDIVFTGINPNGFSIQVVVAAYYSDTDFSFRIGQRADGISGTPTTV